MDSAPPLDMTRQKMIDQFWDTVPPVWSLVRSKLHAAAMEKFEVTEDQWRILRHIHMGADSVSKLAQVKRITRSAISQSIDLLVEKGLVEREYSNRDRRFIRLSLTQAGNDLVSTIFQINRAWMLEKISTLSEEELAAVITGMQLLKQVLLPLENDPVEVTAQPNA